MPYRVTEEEILKVQEEYKKNYAPFRPLQISEANKLYIGEKYSNLLTTQNGRDTDDYCVPDNNKVEKYLASFSGKKALLLGVGTGREILAAKGIGIDACGVTLGSRNVDFARNHLGLGDSISEEVVEALPWPAQTFDVVAGFQTFEHAIAPLLFLLELGRVLKNGGIMILEWPPASQFTGGENPHHQICYTPGQAEALFLKAGLRDIKLYYDDLTNIQPEDYWRGDQNKMLVIEGTKVPSRQDYIRRAWE